MQGPLSWRTVFFILDLICVSVSSINMLVAFRFWMSWAVLEIFAIKVWGCIKSTEILHVFGPLFLFGGRAPEFWACIIKFSQFSIMGQSFNFQDDRPRDLGDNNFFLIFTIKFFGVPVEVCARWLGSTSNAFKIWGRSTPNILSRIMSTWVGQYAFL